MLRFLLSAFVILLSSHITNAALVSWLLGTSGNWNSALNWALSGGGANVLPGLNDDVEITAVGTYNVTVNTNVAVGGTVTLGSSLGSNPTLLIASGSVAQYGTINVVAGAINVASGAELWVSALTFTSPSVNISGDGKLYVNGTLTYATSGGNAYIDVDYNATNIAVSNGATVQITSSGGCKGGVLNLGSGAGGGELLVSGSWQLGDCATTGGGGNLTFQSSSTQWYYVAQNHTLAYLKANGSAQLNVSATVNGVVWVGGNARILFFAATGVQGDVVVVAQGTYNVAVNANLTVSGSLTLGSDTSSGVNPTLWAGSGASANIGSVIVQTGGLVALAANSQLWIHNLTFTAPNATVSGSGSGSGSLNVTGSLSYSTSGGNVVVNTPFSTTGSINVWNGAQLQIASTGWCDSSNGGSIFLGPSGQGGSLVITGNWNHGNCVPTGGAGNPGGGNLTFNSQSTINYALATGTYAVAYLKAAGYSQVWVVSTVAVNGGVWLADNARLAVNQTITVVQNVNATGNAVIEVAGANLNAAAVQFAANTKYILHAATAVPPTVVATGVIVFNGIIDILTQVAIDATTNVTVATYGSYTGAFTSVQVSQSTSAGTMGASFATSRRLLSSSYAVEYDQTNAHAYSTGSSNGVSSLSPSILLLGLIVLSGLLYI